MLKNYYWSAGSRTGDEDQRIIAVQEALEIIKASVSSNTADNNNCKAKWDIEHAAEGLEKLADAIQNALKVK